MSTICLSTPPSRVSSAIAGVRLALAGLAFGGRLADASPTRRSGPTARVISTFCPKSKRAFSAFASVRMVRLEGHSWHGGC
jgi:hypothetical protein